MMFGVPVVAVVIVCYLFTPVNPNNYLAEINHKLHLLDSVEGRRMIFVGGSNVQSILMVVDFPAPLMPKKPNNSPCSTSKLILSTAFTSPKYFFRPFT